MLLTMRLFVFIAVCSCVSVCASLKLENYLLEIDAIWLYITMNRELDL